MHKGVLSAAVGGLLAVLSLSILSAEAMPISAPAALNGTADRVSLADPVSCWDCGYDGYRPYYRPYYRPIYRRYGYHHSYYQPNYGYGTHRRYYRPSYPTYGYGYYSPRPRFYIGPVVYWY